jgi:hypothetical protein
MQHQKKFYDKTSRHIHSFNPPHLDAKPYLKPIVKAWRRFSARRRKAGAWLQRRTDVHLIATEGQADVQ